MQQDLLVPRADVRATPTRELDTTEPKGAAEMHWRLAMPTMTMVAALMALGVARPKPRAGRFARLLPGIGLFIGYYLLLVAVRGFAADDALPAGAGIWGVHALALAAGLWFLRSGSRPR